MNFKHLLQLAIASGLAVMPALAAPASDAARSEDLAVRDEKPTFWGTCDKPTNTCHWAGEGATVHRAGVCTCNPGFECKVQGGGCYYSDVTLVCRCQTGGK
ncbi:hypothetical protein PG987_005121 [Apiospora arundinis]